MVRGSRRLAKGAWKKSFAAAKRSIELGTKVYNAFATSGRQPVVDTFDTLAPKAGTEIKFAGEVPILPRSNPVVILQGTDYAFRALSRCLGQIDFEYMKQVYRRSGILPAGCFDEIAKGYKANGEWGEVTTGHAGNAIVVFMKPSEGRYAAYVGPAARGLTAHAPYPHCGPVYGETNAGWEIRLGSAPLEVMRSAVQKAQERLREAEEHLSLCDSSEPDEWLERAQDLLAKARAENQRGQQLQAEMAGLIGHEVIYHISRATRRFNSAQVHASQVIHMIVPPARLPVNL